MANSLHFSKNRSPQNRCLSCDRPLQIPGNNWGWLRECQRTPHGIRYTIRTHGCVHVQCPPTDDEDDLEFQ